MRKIIICIVEILTLFFHYNVFFKSTELIDIVISVAISIAKDINK